MIAELDVLARLDNLPRWPVRGRPHLDSGRHAQPHTPTPSCSWRVLGLPFCCLRPVTISQWVREGDASMAPVFVCAQCCRVGFREAFEPRGQTAANGKVTR